MKKITLFLSILIIFTLGIGGMCDKKQDAAHQTPTNNQPTATDTDNQPREENFIQKSLKEMMALDKTLKCVITVNDPRVEGTFDQTMYLDSEKFRIDSYVDVPESEMGTMNYHMISDGVWIYTWASGQKNGLKMNIAQMQEMGEQYPNESVDATEASQVDLEQKFDYDCVRWRKDQSLLNPPRDVEFTDFLQQMQNMTGILQNMDANSNEDLCKLCDYETDEQARQQCLSQLGC